MHANGFRWLSAEQLILSFSNDGEETHATKLSSRRRRELFVCDRVARKNAKAKKTFGYAFGLIKKAFKNFQPEALSSEHVEL